MKQAALRVALIIGAFASLLAGCGERELPASEPAAKSDPAVPAELSDTNWRLVEITAADGVSRSPQDRSAYTLQFQADGAAVLQIDCNQGNGGWTSAEPGQLSFGPIATTRMACPPGSLGDAVLAQLQAVTAYSIEDEHLRLRTATDDSTMVFEHGIDAPLAAPNFNFPVSPLYLFDRHQDFAMQRPRGSIPQRNHMRFWLSPVRLDGRPVWVAQLSRDIGIKPTWHSPFLVTHVIDPEVDEDRAYFLELLLRSQSVQSFGYVDGVGAATRAEPKYNLSDDPYRTDGRRLVVVLAEDPVPINQVRALRWQTDPAAALR